MPNNPKRKKTGTKKDFTPDAVTIQETSCQTSDAPPILYQSHSSNAKKKGKKKEETPAPVNIREPSCQTMHTFPPLHQYHAESANVEQKSQTSRQKPSSRPIIMDLGSDDENSPISIVSASEPGVFCTDYEY